MEFVRFAVLGLGAGAMYGLSAQGIVLVHRASGVLNLAQGAMGMFGAYLYFDLRASGWPALAALAAALAAGGALGALTHLAFMRTLVGAPAVTRLIATIAVFTVLVALASVWWLEYPPPVQRLLPITAIELPGGSRVGVDRLILFGVGVALSASLMIAYQRTSFGRLSAAQAEDPVVVASVGGRPDVIAAVNWALGAALSVAASILISQISGLDVIDLALLVVPALAAALVGGFQSFPLAFAGGVGLGMAESTIGHFVVAPGFARSVPFLVIIAVLMVRARALPSRSRVAEPSPPFMTARRRWPLAAIVAVLVLIGSLASGDGIADSLTTTFTIALVVLSLVVVTGMAGQLSLAQLSLAGIGGLIAARLVADAGWSLEVAFLVAVIGAVPVGLVVGAPALRTRGVQLAVVTLGMAYMIDQWVFANADREGGLSGIEVGGAQVLGVDVDAVNHPERYAALTAIVFLLAAFVVANLRRSAAGRQLLAVRSDERVAAALGVNVVLVKLFAFALAAALASAGGVLIAFRNPNVVLLPQFSVLNSIYVVLFGVIGGLGSAMGALASGAVAPGGLITGGIEVVAPGVSDWLAGSPVWRALIALAAVLATALRFGRQSRRSPRGSRRSAASPLMLPMPESTPGAVLLEVEDLTVRFGSVTAVDRVSLSLREGEVVGLIGSNGAGKTTLLDGLSGYCGVATGDVGLHGRSIVGWSVTRRARAGVGRTFQANELFSAMSLGENLLMATEHRSLRRMLLDLVRPRVGELDERQVGLVQQLGLGDVLDLHPDELSFGVRRLAGLARALLTEPRLLLLDEPAAGLEPAHTEAMIDTVVRFARGTKTAVLLVEHDHGTVLRACDRVIVLDGGRKTGEFRPAEVQLEGSEVDLSRMTGRDDGHDRATAPTARPRATARAGRRSGRTESLVRVEDLSGGHHGGAVFDGVSLTVGVGEIVALVGANGSGKTTLLHTLVGLLEPIGGQVQIVGVAGARSLDRRVRAGLGYLGEGQPLTRSLSARDNLLLGRGSVVAAVELFPELEPLLRRRAGDLSGGEQRMVALGRVLAAKPAVVVIDELSLGLSPSVADRLADRLREAADRGTAVLFVEQDVDRALALADRLCVLRQGRLVEDRPVAGTDRRMVLEAIGSG